MTQYAVISDIHANLLALQIVFRDIEKRGIPKENIIFLGDLVGYGAQPFECANLVEERCGHGVMGNNDQGWLEILAKGTDLTLKGFSNTSANSLAWTASEYNRIQEAASGWSIFGKGDVKKQKESADKAFDFIRKLPLDLRLKMGDFNAYCVHANPLDPKKTNDYVFDPNLAKKYGLEEGKFVNPREVFAAPQVQGDDVFFNGHTHERVIYVGDKEGNWKFPQQRIRVSQEQAQGKRIMVNPGSVGYPRSNTKSISYAIVNPEARGKEYLIDIIVMSYWEAASQALEAEGLHDIFKDPKKEKLN